jgi:glycopeptide antibiotics resistance protein
MKTRSFIPAYCFSLLLWVMASLPGEDVERVKRLSESQLLMIILSDPFIHFLVFGLLALLICRGFYQESWRSIPLSSVAILVIGYSFLIEVYQGILPWRSFGLDDLVWNTAGVLFFLVPVRVYKGGIRGVVEK